MSQDWISSRYGRLVYGLAQDDRPAWVWSVGADASLWQNQAARWFHGKRKDGQIIPASPARPIRGQIKRLLRLGFAGVTSLARVQMLVGDHPVSQTCRCTPIVLADGEQALLCVSADAVMLADDEKAPPHQPMLDQLFPHLGAYALVDADNVVLSGSPSGIAAAQDDGFEQARRLELGNGVSVLVFNEADVQPEAEGLEAEAAPHVDLTEPETGRLTNLMERFDSDSNLYEPLGPEDDVLPEALVPEVNEQPFDDEVSEAPDGPEDDLGPEDDFVDSADIEDLETLDGAEDVPALDWPEEQADEIEQVAETPDENEEPQTVQWRVTGRGFVPDVESAPDGSADAPDEELDQAARYNFDELARILTDKVSVEAPVAPVPHSPRPERRSAATLSLSDEHLVLNRLPLGILVFRDQDIVFANRAMADLLACASIADVRERGLDAIFPRMDDPGVSPGPVAVLMDSNGTQVPVSARLQAITWHGGPALMLSARREDSTPDGEILVRNFVETLAASRGDGFVEISRAGVVEGASGRAVDLLDRGVELVIGRPLGMFVAPDQLGDFKQFLEKPARRAGVDRPGIRLETTNGVELSLFTEGSAGIVTGYFGLLAAKASTPTSTDGPEEPRPGTDANLMGRMSRGLRRPLNTIIGFSQLLENQAFGALGHPRYLEYARDIQAAGRDIEGLVDELDQYDGLHDDAFLADASDFALDELLSECEGVVRHQASRRQVFVRSAISEQLPFIRADRTLMRQALLNLLASAIDQTPLGGKVILSAQVEDDGSVGVHVRDSGNGEAEFSERFAVFREGSARHGEAMVPMKSSIGLALTRSLLAVNSCALTIDPSSGTGTLMSLSIPADQTRQRRIQAE